jgi:hypothetical protein
VELYDLYAHQILFIQAKKKIKKNEIGGKCGTCEGEQK